MRRAAALIGVLGLGLLAGRALADPLPLPPLPTTVPTSVPLPVPVPIEPAPVVPLPTVPKLPDPVVAAPAPVEAAAAEAGAPKGSAAEAAASVAGSLAGPDAARPSSSGSSCCRFNSSGTAPRSRSVKHLHSSRSWIGTSGKKSRRTTTLTFVLPRAARVFFTVTQVAPVCQVAGRFSFRGHTGLNRVRFTGRLRGKQLGAGTYRITARTPGGQRVSRVTIVVVDGSAPSPEQLAAARASNVCSAATRGIASRAFGSTGALSASGVARAEQVQRSFQPKAQRGSNAHSGVLTGAIEVTAEATRPFLVAALVLSILLLALASLPTTAFPGPRAGDFLVRHRTDIVLVGTGLWPLS